MMVRDCAIVARSMSVEIYSLLPFRAAAPNGRSCVISPIIQIRSLWHIHSISIVKQFAWPEPLYPAINLLIRYKDHPMPWPTNTLHYCAFQPNPTYTPTQEISPRNLPYLRPPTEPLVLPAPLRMFAKWHMAMGEYGTVVWIDTHTEDQFGPTVSEAQRLVGALVRTSSRSPQNGLMAEMFHGISGRGSWRQIAVNEQEGQIAIGHANGTTSIFSYSP
jgi:hypothetical protein